MEICNHEFDLATIKWHPKYGRIGKCIKCGRKIMHINYIPAKRVRPKIKKKARIKLKKMLKENKE